MNLNEGKKSLMIVFELWGRCRWFSLPLPRFSSRGGGVVGGMVCSCEWLLVWLDHNFE